MKNPREYHLTMAAPHVKLVKVLLLAAIVSVVGQTNVRDSTN
ncbi:hypothetical protein [Limosilactobacillus coleohominis]|nr:hypothetical protein [Limosilactobacillus coleohominis]